MADLAQLAASPEKRMSKLSRLMQAKAKALDGEKVNFCPFGCATGDLDDHGYCRHLVGFTTDGKFYEPMVRDAATGRRVVRPKMTPKYPDAPVQPGPSGEKPDVEMVPVLEPVLKTDKLELITISSRVYRDVDAVKAIAPPEEAEDKPDKGKKKDKAA